MDFEIELLRDESTNLYIQLYRKLKSLILAKRIKEHDKLPAIRELASEVEVNPATVVKAYDLLERDDLIYKKVGSGSYVSPIKRDIDEASLEANNQQQDAFEMLGHGQLQLEESINFASATPSASLFPVKDFKYAINGVLDRDRGEAFTYQKSQGYYPLRESVNNYLSEMGIKSQINNVQIVSGAQQAIDLLVKVLINYGDKVIVEEPTYSGALSALRSREAVIESIPLKKDGMDMDKLKSKLKANDIELVYVMTSFQNPSGITWSREKKEELLDLSQKYDFLIIEDDCLSELYFDREKPTSLKALDNSDKVIYIKSISKIFMPGLRLAFVILPDELLSSVLAAKHATDISSAGLTQRAFDLYLREGLWYKHLEKMRQLFGERYRFMSNTIQKHLPQGVEQVYQPDGGLYFWMKLPDMYKSKDLYFKAGERGVAFLPGNLFLANRENTPYFRLSFAAVDQDDIEVGIRSLAAVCRDLMAGEREKGFTPLV